MKNNGQKRKTVDQEVINETASERELENGQILVTKSEIKKWIKEV
jgi:hypothetical protein